MGRPSIIWADARIQVWGSVDWAEQDVFIAERLGTSRERVRQKRCELGMPRAANHRGARTSAAVLQWLAENRNAISGRLLDDVCQECFPLERSTVERLLKRLDIPFYRIRDVFESFSLEMLPAVTVRRGDCWEWKLGTCHGYPRIRQEYVHQIVYRLSHGPPQTGQRVFRTCGNVRCLNPDHITAGTPREQVEHRRRRPALTMKEARSIRQARSEGRAVAELAREYGTCIGTIWKVLWNQTHREELASASA